MTAGLQRWGVILLAGALCCAAWAGNVSVEVEDGGAAVAGAIVSIEPGGPNGTTNPAGKWHAAGVAAGDYRVIAWKTIAGTLRGAIADVTVPAAGNVDVSLALEDAVWTYNHLPYGVGNMWQYRYHHTGPDGTWTATWRENVDSATTIGGEPAVVLLATKDGVHEWKELRGSTRAGFAMYAQEHGGDTIKFDPPIRLGALLPLGYEWVATSTAHHSDGSPDDTMLLRCKLAGFDTITVPAGTFTDAARLEVVQTMGSRTDELTIWTAHNVGIVRQIEKNTERTNTKLLEEYRIRGLPMMRPLRPIGPIFRRP